MTTAQGGDAPVYRWVKDVLGSPPPTVVVTGAWAVLGLLVAQRVPSAARARALPAAPAGSGRSCLRRVRCWGRGPALAQATSSPPLIRLALALRAADQPVVVALATTRRGRWDVGLAGIGVAGRPLPIGGAGIPYPWPQGRFRATTLAGVPQLQQACPAEGRGSLVAARGFPPAALWAHRRPGGTAFSGRLRVRDWVTGAGGSAMGVNHWAAGRRRGGQRRAAAMGCGRPEQPLVPGGGVVSAVVVAAPPHQQNPGTGRERAARAQRQAQHRQHKQGRKTQPPRAAAPRYAQTWLLCTPACTGTQAVAEDAGRRSSEETSRAWHPHGAVRAAVVDGPTAAMGAQLIGVVCLADPVQMP